MNEVPNPKSMTEAGAEHFDVLIVGAGISGIGSAHHLKEQCPEKSFVILECKESHGGTWLTHTYPGIRSDSDLYTFGYRFKPWAGNPVAEAPLILDYMQEVIDEDDLDRHIRYGHKVLKADWSSADKCWVIEAERTDTGAPLRFTANFLWMCQGYYDHDKPYTPEWDGFEDYKGQIVHPQHWPEDIDYKNKRVVVIGSGATAATIIPAMADDCEHMTMVQRSPTYFYTGENRNELADRLRALDLPEEWVHEIVRKDILKQQLDIQRACVSHPDAVKEELFSVIRGIMGEDFDMDTHFHPNYRPWQQRLAYIPDGDLFHAIKSGKVSVETDHIDRFTEKGLLLKSGKELEADIIITATGFNLSVLGNIPFHVNGKPVDFADAVTYRGIMFSGVPNMAWVFGYLRTSWTMRSDLIGDFVCRLLNAMKERGADVVTPTLPEAYSNLERQMWIDPEGFNPGYIMRKQHLMPKRIDKEPWTFTTDYYTEKDTLPAVDMAEDALVYA